MSSSLVGGRNVSGIKLTVTINIKNIIPSCGKELVQISEFKIKDISITRPFGIDVEGVEVENIGIAPGFCLKELKASYDGKEDMLSFALAVVTPFIEIGGGLEFEKGTLETVELKAELQNSIIPIATTGIGLIGGEGKISKISSPPMGVRIGGIFTAVISDDLFRLTTSAEYLPPSEIKLEAGDGKLFHPPFYDEEWWLLEGGIYGSIDLSTYRLRLGGSLNAVPYEIDGKDKKFILSGTGVMSYKDYPGGGAVTGQLNGKITIPKLGSEWPYDWMSAKVGLPYSVEGSALLVYKNTARFITGDLNLGTRIGKMHYDINLNKRYDEEGFFSYQLKGVDLTTALRSNNSVTFQVPAQTRLAILKLTGKSGLPAVTLTSPGGSSISETQPGDFAEFDKLEMENKLFVTLYQPEPGAWTVTSQMEDSMEVFYTPYDYSFELSAALQAGSVDLAWNRQDFGPADSLEFYIDEDSSGFDGIRVGVCAANLPEYIIPLGAAGNLCSFYVYALASRDGLLKSKYAPLKIFNPDTELPAPANLKLSYTPSSGILEVQWNPVSHDSLTGYVLGLDSAGNKRLLRMLYPNETNYRDTIHGLSNPVIYIQSYGAHGLVSCPVFASPSVAAKDQGAASLNQKVRLYPNPTLGRLQMETLPGLPFGSPVLLVDLLGRTVETFKVQPDWILGRTVELDLSGLSEGTYFLTGYIGKKWFAEKVMVVKR